MAHDFTHQDDFFRQLLGDVPEAAFFSAIQPFSQRGPRRRRFAESQFDPIQNRFLGELGNQARQGQVPNLNFADFTGGLDFDRLFFDQPLNFRRPGVNLTPRTRFLTGF